MNIILLFTNLCCRVFYGSTYFKNKRLYQETRPLPSQIIHRFSTPSYSVNTQINISFKATPAVTRQEPFLPHSFRQQTMPTPFSFEPPVQKPAEDKQTPTINQNLHNQINQLQRENDRLFATIAVDSSLCYAVPLMRPSSCLSQENQKRQQLLEKLQRECTHLSNFCNQEMMQIVQFVTQSHQQLNDQLFKLRERAGQLENDTLLAQHVERIDILEKAETALDELEKRFQSLQKRSSNATEDTRTSQENYVNSLFTKLENLYEQQHFLQECKQQLNGYSAYDRQELQQLMQAFEQEKESLTQRISNTRQQLQKGEQFAQELTNHLLDYAKIFEGCFSKLQKCAPIRPSISPVLHTVPPVAEGQSRVQTAQNSAPYPNLLKAAHDVTEALNKLITSFL